MSLFAKLERLCLRSIFAATPATSAYTFRSRLLSRLGHVVGNDVRVVSSARILGPKVTFGDNVFVGHQVLIIGGTESTVAIGSNVDIGPRVMVLAGSHDVGGHEHRAGQDRAYDIRVEDGCWIGAGATLVGPVTIGAGSVVAAGSVVVRSVQADSLVGGNPAVLKRALV